MAEIRKASADLGAIAPSDSEEGRSLASYREPLLTDREREKWKDWARDRLVEVQRLKDRTEAHSPLQEAKAELNHAANELVQFYAETDRGETEKMKQALMRIREGSERASEMCGKK